MYAMGTVQKKGTSERGEHLTMVRGPDGQLWRVSMLGDRSVWAVANGEWHAEHGCSCDLCWDESAELALWLESGEAEGERRRRELERMAEEQESQFSGQLPCY